MKTVITPGIFLSYLGTKSSSKLSNDQRDLVIRLYKKLDKYFYKEVVRAEEWEAELERTHATKQEKVA